MAVDLISNEPLTAASLAVLLRGRYKPESHALFLDVPDAVGTDARRRIDALAIGLWKSSGRLIEGFELKISRSDWLRELKQVEKADPFLAVCDHFWLVTAEASIAKLEELPACWGWLSATPSGLRVQKPATKLPGVGNAVPRAFMLGVLRKMQEDRLSSADVRAHIEQQVALKTRDFEGRVANAAARERTRSDQLEQRIREFESQSGIALGGYHLGPIGAIVKALLALDYSGDAFGEVPRIMERQEGVLRELLEKVIHVRALLGGPPVRP